MTMTPAEIIFHRRVAVLEHAQKSGKVAETSRVFGISRTRYYSWRRQADDAVARASRPGLPRPRLAHAGLLSRGCSGGAAQAGRGTGGSPNGPRPSCSRMGVNGGCTVWRRCQLAPSTTSECPEM